MFLSAPEAELELRFEQHGDLGVVMRKNFVRAVQFHQFPGAPKEWSAHKIPTPLARSIAMTLRDKIGIRERQGKLHVNEWQLGSVLHWVVYSLFELQDGSAHQTCTKLTNDLFGDWSGQEQNGSFSLELAAGHRPFELLMERGNTQWFTRNLYADPTEPEKYGAASRLLRAHGSRSHQPERSHHRATAIQAALDPTERAG